MIVSTLFSIQQKQTIILNIWQIKTFQDVNDTSSVLEHMEQNNTLYPERDFLFYLRVPAGSIQLVYLFVNALFIIIDGIATVTFIWKEYGELTHKHTSKSKWQQRFLAALTVTSIGSLQTTQVIINFYTEGTEGTMFRHIPDKAINI